MTKKFLALSLVAFGLAACNSTKTNQSDTTDSLSAEMPQEVVAMPGVGVYTGTIPGADVTGLDVTLELRSDMTFVEQSVVEAGNNESGTFEESGTYTLDAEQLTLNFTTVPQTKKAILRGDSIQLLDSEGNLPTMPYVLRLKK